MIKLNEKGQCPYCRRKPLTYKRTNKYFCAGCSRQFNLSTGKMEENFCWTADGKCKHAGRPKYSQCPECGAWQNIDKTITAT